MAKILLIEDDKKISRSVCSTLEAESFTVQPSYDGDSGAEHIMTGEYDIAVIDRMIPGSMNGIEVIKAAREAGIQTPVLILSALRAVDDRTEGLYAGADDYLTKPFAVEELIARVRTLLRRPASRYMPVLTYADVVLDTRTREVRRAATRIVLTGKEFALLELLMLEPNVAKSKDEIISHIWGSEANVLPNTVEVYIKYLRNKLEKGFDMPLIHTVYGSGYKISELK